MKDLIGQQWHTLKPDNLAKLFETDLKEGLGQFSVKHRLEFFGKNVIEGAKKVSPLKMFLLQFDNALIYILLFASIVTGILQEYIDSGVIFAVVIINVVVGYIQESKAHDAIESLKSMMDIEAIVLREGKKNDISASLLVPGDIVFLESGSKVPADIRIFESFDLKVNESMLTGESLPVEKNPALLKEDITLADKINMLYSGTYVTYGQAKGIVVATAQNTEIGKIAHLIKEATSLETPLTKKISEFSKFLLYIILFLALVTFITGMIRDYAMVDIFMASVALAVGAIPEGLPAAVTITLAIGVNTMAKKNSIIRKLPAVETLGSVTVICSDKTGTLTENKMSVKNIYCDGKSYDITGNN